MYSAETAQWRIKLRVELHNLPPQKGGKMQKIIIPTYIEYNACQLTIDNLDNFKKFISKNAYDIRITYKEMKNKNIPVEINFR